MIGKATQGESFAGLARYLTGEEERVANVQALNTFETEPMAVAQEMQDAAAKSRAEKPVYHLSISFDASDDPSWEQMQEVAKETLRDLGLQDHPALLVEHTDREHPHIHIMVSRVETSRGADNRRRAWNPWQDRRRIKASLERQERARGFRRTGRNVGDPEKSWGYDQPSLSIGARKMAAARGEEPFPERVRRAALQDFEEASGWADLEERLSVSGLYIEPRGTGGVVTDGKTSASLSNISRRLSLPKLEQKYDRSFSEHREEKNAMAYQNRDHLSQKERSAEALGYAASFYEKKLRNLPEKHPAKAYLKERGISREQQQTYQIGYAPDAWGELKESAAREGFSSEDLEAAGLAKERNDGKGHYDRFRGRITFPVTNAGGEVKGFGARKVVGLDGSPMIRKTPELDAKYLNSPKTEHYDKSRLVFGHAQAQRAIEEQREVVVTEGYTDAMRMREAGQENAVALAGTRMTKEHAEVLRESADRAVFVLDGDDAGRSATQGAVEKSLRAGMEPHVVDLPEGHDADTYAREHGGGALRSYVKEHREHWADRAGAQLAGADPRERSEIMRRSVSMAALSPAQEQREEQYGRVREAMLRGEEGEGRKRLSALLQKHYEHEVKSHGQAQHGAPTQHGASVQQPDKKRVAQEYEKLFGRPALEKEEQSRKASKPQARAPQRSALQQADKEGHSKRSDTDPSARPQKAKGKKQGGPAAKSKTKAKATGKSTSTPKEKTRIGGDAIRTGAAIARELADPITDERDAVRRAGRFITSIGQIAARYADRKQRRADITYVDEKSSGRGRNARRAGGGKGRTPRNPRRPTPDDLASVGRGDGRTADDGHAEGTRLPEIEARREPTSETKIRRAEKEVARWAEARQVEDDHEKLSEVLKGAEAQIKEQEALGRRATAQHEELGRRVRAAYQEPERAAETLRMSVREDGHRGDSSVRRTAEDLTRQPERFGSLVSTGRGTAMAREEAKGAAAALTTLDEIKKEQLPADLHEKLQEATGEGRSTLARIEERLSERGTSRELRGSMEARVGALRESEAAALKERVGADLSKDVEAARMEHVVKATESDYALHERAHELQRERTTLTREVRKSERALEADDAARGRLETMEEKFSRSLKEAYQKPRQAKAQFEAVSGDEGAMQASRQMRSDPSSFGALRQETSRKYLGLSKSTSTEKATRAARRAASEGKTAVQIGAGRSLGDSARQKLERKAQGMKSRIREVTKALEKGGTTKQIAGRMQQRARRLSPKARRQVAKGLSAGPKAIALKGALVAAQQTKQVVLDRQGR